MQQSSINVNILQYTEVSKICYFLKNSCAPGEREQIIQKLHRFSSHKDLQIRQMIADNICKDHEIPESIVNRLICDVPQIACPVIKFSPVLHDKSLKQLIDSTEDLKKLKAIARRKTIGGQVVEALVRKTLDFAVIDALLGNKGAKINNKAYKIILGAYINNKSIILKSIQRYMEEDNYGISSLLESLSQNVGDELMRNYSLQSIKESYKLSFDNINASQMQLIDKLYNSGLIQEHVLINYLRAGNINAYAYCISRLTDISYNKIIACILDINNNPASFEGIYYKSELSIYMCEAFKLLLCIMITRIKNKTMHKKNFLQVLIQEFRQESEVRNISLSKYVIRILSSK